MGLFYPFLDDASVDIFAVEAAGEGIETGRPWDRSDGQGGHGEFRGGIGGREGAWKSARRSVGFKVSFWSKTHKRAADSLVRLSDLGWLGGVCAEFFVPCGERGWVSNRWSPLPLRYVGFGN